MTNVVGRHWSHGDVVTLRYTGHYDTQIRDKPGLLQGIPHRVIEDRADLLALWISGGSLRNYIDLSDRTREVAPTTWRRDTIRLMFPGKPYSILQSPRAQFNGWYVNLEAPFVRTAIGVDTSDNELDIVVAPDRSWRWKDEEAMQRWIDLRVFTPEDVQRFYEEGKQAVAEIEAARLPFDGAYLDWSAPADWDIPLVHPEWGSVPGYDWSHAIKRRVTGVDHLGLSSRSSSI